jgi:7-cyano-7-deazaguanine reductase
VKDRRFEAIKEKVAGLKLTYKKHAQKGLLVAIPNPAPGRDYDIEAVSPEFTSLCPLNPAQPDYAKITVRYTPDRSLVELKSLKFYLTSYRTAEIFFEEATNNILDDLVACIRPRRMEVIADWNVRGGIAVSVKVCYNKPL